MQINFVPLDKLISDASIDVYDVRGEFNEVRLFWSDLRNATEVDIYFVRTFNGDCYEPPATAYYYYNS
jgi:hypothetical protein